MRWLERIRKPMPAGTMGQKAAAAAGALLLGTVLGIFAKYMDGPLPDWLHAVDAALDFHNFLGGFGPWLWIAVCLSLASRTPWQAAARVFFFFAGMVAGYYIYGWYVLGFFPRQYAAIWVAFTLVSPVLAFLCWYAAGQGPAALLLSAGILGVMYHTAFAWGMFYLDVRSWLNVGVLCLTVWALHRSWRRTVGALGLGILVALCLDFLPIPIW